MSAVPDRLPPAAPSTAAQWLGHAGWIPFVAGAALAWVASGPARAQVTAALAGYGALIVSFLGGIHWGLAMRRSPPPTWQLAWGVVPSLIGWAAVLLPTPVGLLLIAAMLLTCYRVDRRVYPAAGLAAWLPLRLQLSVVAGVSCVLGALAG